MRAHNGRPVRSGVEERVSSVETSLDSLSTQFREHRTAVEGRLDMIGLRLSDLRVPNVSTWIAIAGVAIGGAAIMVTIGMGIMAAFASGFIRDQDRIDGEVRLIETRFNEYIADLPAKQVQEWATRNRDNLKDLDVTLQREMRTLDDAMKAEITGMRTGLESEIHSLDARLQREMELRERALRQHLPAMKNGGQ